MKKIIPLLLILLCALLSSSCVSYKDADTYFGALGLDADEVTLPGKLVMQKPNMSRGLGKITVLVEKMYKAFLWKQGLVEMGALYYNHLGKVVDGDTTVKLQELKNAASEAEFAHKAKETELLLKSGQ